MSGQLTLLPTEAPALRRERLPLEAIDGFAGACPSAKLRELIRELGLLQPVVVVPGCFGSYRIVEGRRRCMAMWQLAQAGEWPTPPRVDAIIIDDGQTTRREVRGGLTLALHASRSASPASELQAIEAILAKGGGDGEAAAVKEIAAQTGISVQTVQRRLRLRSLVPALRAAFDEGAITASVAEAAARLSEAQQTVLEQRLSENGGLTLAQVWGAAREQTSSATAELPAELFSDQGAAWQTTVRGHLVAAVESIPERSHQVLRQLVEHALEAVDRL